MKKFWHAQTPLWQSLFVASVYGWSILILLYT